MSEWEWEERNRLIVAVEKIAASKSIKDENAIAAGMHNAYAIEIEQILDTMGNDFELRRALRNLVKQAKEMGGG